MALSDFFEVEETSLDKAKQMFIDNMDMLKAMTVQEQTLYKKFQEVKYKYNSKIDPSRVTKARIWVPSDITDADLTVSEIEAMQPRIRWVVPGSADESDWLMLRVFSHTMEFSQNPGRFLKFLVYDEVSDQYLGAVSLGSDVITITARDNWIGWDRDDRIGGMLNHSAIGTCIMSTQPFGYNFLGGKLVASLLTTRAVAEVWEKLYDNVLVGLTTTSLYGGHSMYQRIPFWKEMGKSKGAISIKPDDDVYDYWHQYVKEHMWEDYNARINKKEDTSSGPVTGVKQQILSMIYRAVGASPSKYRHGFERGVYYAPLYENTREFLQQEITREELVPLKRLERDVDAVLDWWKPKAIKRYRNLVDQGRIKPEILYYNRMVDMTWEEAKRYYLGEVGR